MNVKIKKYKALGLLEMLIAMGVAGIALVVFMTMATNSMSEAIRYERQDALTRLAMDGALVVRRHAELAQSPRENVSFPHGSSDQLIRGWCYRIDFSAQRVYDQRVQPHVLKTTNPPHQFRRNIVYDDSRNIQDQAYVAYCVNDIEEMSTRVLYSGRVVAGYVAQYDGIEEYDHPVIVVISL